MAKKKPSNTKHLAPKHRGKFKIFQFNQLGVTVTNPSPGPQVCATPFSVYGNFTGGTIKTLAATLIGPNGVPIAGTQVNPPTEGQWQFNFPAGVPQLNTQYSLVIEDTTNPGTAVIIAFSCTSPTLAIGGIVTNQPIFTLTGTTSATGLISGGASAASFGVKELTDGSGAFEVTAHLSPGTSTLQLLGNAPTAIAAAKSKAVPLVSLSVTVIPSTAPPNAPVVTVLNTTTFQVQWSSPMADTAFNAGIYTLQDTTDPNNPISIALGAPVQLDFQTLTLAIVDLTTPTFTPGDDYTLSIDPSVTDQAGNAYTAGDVDFTAP